MKIKSILSIIVGTLGALFSSIFGAWSSDLITLLCFMCADFLSGIALAVIFKKSTKSPSGALESRACFKGLVRKFMLILIVGIANRLDIALGATYIRSAVIIAFISNEGISILENASLMGIPLPKAVKNALDVLSSRAEMISDDGETEDEGKDEDEDEGEDRYGGGNGET